MKRYLKNQKGEAGPALIVVYVAIIGVTWFLISWIISVIYDTKEERAEQGRNRGKGTTTTLIDHVPGGYTVEYNQ